MSHCRRLLIVLFIAALSQTSARAGYTVTITPSIGPNAADYSYLPSVQQYYTNAQTALQNGYVTSGTPGTAGYYSALSGSVVPIRSITTTQFPSWMAVAPPSGAYSGQYGNSLYFGVAIRSTAGTTTSFTLASLNGSGVVTDPQGNLGYSYTGYSPSPKIYVQTSLNGPWVASSTVNANTPLYGLISVGSTDSLNGSYYTIPGTNQQIINYNLLQAGTYNYNYLDTYSFTDSGGNLVSGSVLLDIQGVPEPASWTLLGVGAIGLMWRRYARPKVA